MSTVILPPIQNTTVAIDGLNNKNLYPIPQPSTDLLYNYAFFFVKDNNSTFVVPPSEDGKPIMLYAYGYGYARFASNATDYNLSFKVQNNSGVTIHAVLKGRVYDGGYAHIESAQDMREYVEVYKGFEIGTGITKKIGDYTSGYDTRYSETSPIEAQCIIFYEAS